MNASKPINRRLAIVLALASMWLGSIVGVIWLIHFHDWTFFGLHGHGTTTIIQIGAFYLAWVGTWLPATFLAGAIIGASDFKRPLRTAFWTVSAYLFIFSVITALRWPWRHAQDLDQWVPITAYMLSTFFLIGFSVFCAWFMIMYERIRNRYFAH